jgi:hypothetical protein
MPEGRVQYVQQLTPEVIWNAASLAHTNAITGLKALYVVADDAPEVAARWARFSGLLPFSDGDLIRLDCARGRVYVGDRKALAEVLGEVAPAPGIAGYAFGCRDWKAFVKGCTRLGLAVRKTVAGHAVSLPPALGGVWLLEG